MSNRNRRIKHELKKIRKSDQRNDPHYDYHQPHCNDRWRTIRKLDHFPADVILSQTGVYTFWATPFIDEKLEKHLRDDPNRIPDENWLKERQTFLDHKQYADDGLWTDEEKKHMFKYN